MKKIIVLLIVLMLSGCATATPKNEMIDLKSRDNLQAYLFWSHENGRSNAEFDLSVDEASAEAEELKQAIIANVEKALSLEKEEVERNEIYDRQQVIVKNVADNEFIYLFSNGGIRYMNNNENKETSYICKDEAYGAIYEEIANALLEIKALSENTATE